MGVVWTAAVTARQVPLFKEENSYLSLGKILNAQEVSHVVQNTTVLFPAAYA